MARLPTWMQLSCVYQDGPAVKVNLTLRPWHPSFWVWLWRSTDAPWYRKACVLPGVLVRFMHGASIAVPFD